MQRDKDDGPLDLSDIAQVVRSLEALDRECEGVAMYVVLEDRVEGGSGAATFGPEVGGPTLADLAGTYGHTLYGETGPQDEAGIAGVLEVLAATRFTPYAE